MRNDYKPWTQNTSMDCNQIWILYSVAWEDPRAVLKSALAETLALTVSLAIPTSLRFDSWLQTLGVPLAFSTYRANRTIFLGTAAPADGSTDPGQPIALHQTWRSESPKEPKSANSAQINPKCSWRTDRRALLRAQASIPRRPPHQRHLFERLLRHPSSKLALPLVRSIPAPPQSPAMRSA